MSSEGQITPEGLIAAEGEMTPERQMSRVSKSPDPLDSFFQTIVGRIYFIA